MGTRTFRSARAAALGLLLLVAPLRAAAPADETPGLQVPIPLAYRVYNATGRQCVYCSLETLARYAGITNLTDLTAKYRTESDPNRIGELLTRRGIRYVMQMPGDKRTDLLARAVAVERRGAAVGLRGQHMVAVVHWSPQTGQVKILSNLKPSREVQTIPMAQFLKLWDGWTVVIYPGGLAPIGQAGGGIRR